METFENEKRFFIRRHKTDTRITFFPLIFKIQPLINEILSTNILNDWSYASKLVLNFYLPIQ